MSDDWDFVVNWDADQAEADVAWNGEIPDGWEAWRPLNPQGEDKILIQLNPRGPSGFIDIVAWPEWGQLLDFGLSEWHWADADTAYEPNGEGGWISTTPRLVSVRGTVTSLNETAVPVPAAVWLFGSALGLLGWMRRTMDHDKRSWGS